MTTAPRLKVLISAYACEPGKGSEPEVGWQWALQMARFHDVTVLTRTNNRAAIEAALVQLEGKQPLPRFVYHERHRVLLGLKQHFKAVKFYYLLWQRSAREVIQSLHQVHQFDLMHHVTFAAFRYPVAIWGHGVPTIWGPVGGIESIPRGLLPWAHTSSLMHELTRNAHNLLQGAGYQVLPRRARATSLILASTREMQQVFAKLGFQAQVMPTIGLDTTRQPAPARKLSSGPLRLLFVGNIITLKGVDLALDALEQSGIDASFTLVGSGNYVAAAKKQVARLGLQDRVQFLGRLPREKVLELYRNYDLFLFPSLHDTGGYAVIEAMLNELPVVCLDCGGPAVAVNGPCGSKVPMSSRAEVVNGLAQALRQYDEDRPRLLAHGRAAREAILRDYDWERKGEQMARCYEAVYQASRQTPPRSRYSGMGGLTNLLHGVFSARGLAVALVALFLVGALGFASLAHLKSQASNIVSDTLPGLSFAGEANANLAEAFNRSLLVVLTESPQERHRLRQEINQYSTLTTHYLDAYRGQMFASDDERLFEKLLERRATYVQVRERVFNLLETNQRALAVALCREELLPAYQHYKEAGDRLFEFNMRQGQQRGHSIMRVCTATQFLVAMLGILVFLIGFLAGLFK